jgi:hypothetical protein
VRAVHGLRLEKQVVEWLDEECFDFGQRPVMTQVGSGAGAHGHFLDYAWLAPGTLNTHRRDTDVRHI